MSEACRIRQPCIQNIQSCGGPIKQSWIEIKFHWYQWHVFRLGTEQFVTKGHLMQMHRNGHMSEN